jgi:hypothetical protein
MEFYFCKCRSIRHELHEFTRIIYENSWQKTDFKKRNSMWNLFLRETCYGLKYFF